MKVSYYKIDGLNVIAVNKKVYGMNFEHMPELS